MQLQCLCEVEAPTDISFLRIMYHFSYIHTYLLTKLQTERSAATETWQTKAGKPWGSSVWIGETNHHISPMQQQQQQFLMACLIINNCCTSEQPSATRRRFAFDDDTRRPATRCIKNTRCIYTASKPLYYTVTRCNLSLIKHTSFYTEVIYSVSQKSSPATLFAIFSLWTCVTENNITVAIVLTIPIFTPILVNLSEYLHELYRFH